MPSTLDFGPPTTAQRRQAALREQRKREKQEKQRRSHQLLAQERLPAEQPKQQPKKLKSKPSVPDIDDFDIASTYCHSFQVNEQPPVEFREPHYTVNGFNRMTWAECDSRCPDIIQDPITRCRPQLDLYFQDTVNEKTRAKAVSE